MTSELFVVGLLLVSAGPQPLSELVDHRFHQKRMAVLIDEYADGQKRPQSYTETEVIAALKKMGVRFIDAAQANKLRGLASGRDFLEGKVPAVVTSIEADYILAGVVEADRVDAGLKDLVAFTETANLRVIATDSSEIVDTVSVAKMGQDFTVAKALQVGGKRLGDAIARSLSESQAGPALVDLTVEGVLGQKAIEGIELGLKSIAGVSKTSVVHHDEKVLKIELTVSDVTAQQIARDIDRTRPGGVSVKGFSNRAIAALFEPPPGVRLTIGKLTAPAKIGKSIPGAVSRGLAAAISSCGCVDLSEGGSVPKQRTFQLNGTYQPVGDSVMLSASVIRASDRASVATAQKSCPIAELGSCVSDVGDRLGESMKKWLAANAPAQAPAVAKTPVRVRAKIGDLFPSLLGRYADKELGAGSVRIENDSQGALENLTLTVGIDGYTTADIDVPLTDLAPGAVIEPKLPLVLNKKKLSAHDETANSIMRLTVAYSDGDYRLQETFRQPVLIHPRTAMRWSPEESIASFVESTSPEIIAEKDRIETAIPAELTKDPIAFPAAAFQAMRELAYSADPIHPHRSSDIDFVQFPLETLRRKRGDCDDLAIVYASLLEAAGIRSALLLTPGHVLVAFETPIPIHGSHSIIPQGMDFIRREGVVWIPIETTKVGASFSEAWSAATKELSKSTPKLIALSEAWKTFPPTNLAQGGAVLAQVRGEDLAKQLSAVRPDPKLMRAAAVEISGQSAKELDRRGILLAKAGDLAEAKKHFEAGLKADPAYTPAMIHLANLELIEGRFVEALKRYEQALKRSPKSSEACLNALIAARLSGDNGSLARYMDRCEKQPGFSDLEEYLGRSRPEQVGLPAGGRAHLPVWGE